MTLESRKTSYPDEHGTSIIVSSTSVREFDVLISNLEDLESVGNLGMMSESPSLGRGGKSAS